MRSYFRITLIDKNGTVNQFVAWGGELEAMKQHMESVFSKNYEVTVEYLEK